MLICFDVHATLRTSNRRPFAPEFTPPPYFHSLSHFNIFFYRWANLKIGNKTKGKSISTHLKRKMTIYNVKNLMHFLESTSNQLILQWTLKRMQSIVFKMKWSLWIYASKKECRTLYLVSFWHVREYTIPECWLIKALFLFIPLLTWQSPVLWPVWHEKGPFWSTLEL